MADLKKLALGGKGVKGPPQSRAAAPPSKPLEQSCKAEVDEIAQAFRDRMKREDGRKRVATDSEFWFCVYFQSRQEKEAFLKKHGLLSIGDKYLSGDSVDRILGKQRTQAKDIHKTRR